MAKSAARRIVNVRKNQVAVHKPARNISDTSSGGIPVVIGNTADMADATNLGEKINKGVYGLFEQDIKGPHYSVVEGNILDNSKLKVIEPVYRFKDLLKIAMASTILRQCVDAYVTNIESYGVDLEYVGPEGQENSRAAQNEKARIMRVLVGLTNDDRPLQKHREDSRVDKEILGARAFEIIRDAAGRVVGFDHIPAVTLRMTSKERDHTEYMAYDSATGSYVQMRRRFRRFIQVDNDGKKTWFKEYGDPRPIDPKTGEVDWNLSIEDEATEVYYEAMYFPGTPYGIPRWSGAIPALLGAREAEMVNLNFFRDNAIPAMAVLVSGGALTEESFDKIDNYINGVRGSASMNRIVVMEAVNDYMGNPAGAFDGSLPAPKVDIKPMLSERQHEGLFQKYIEDTERKARSSFRLPPIYIGSASEYNRASAFASMLTADQQIFVPERQSWDEMFHRIVLSTHAVKFWRARSTGPGLQDPAEVARIVQSLGKEGALTPNVAIKIANRYLDADIQPIMEDWGDFPFSIITEYVKSGKKITGLYDFVENIDQATAPAAGNLPIEEEEPVKDETDKVQKVVRRLLDDALAKMQDKLDDTLQSIAEETV